MRDHSTLLASKIELPLGLFVLGFKAQVVGGVGADRVALVGQTPLGLTRQLGRGALPPNCSFKHDGHPVANGLQLGQKM